MRQTTLYKNGNSLSYAEYGDKSGFPILIQHDLIASINDYPLFDLLIELPASSKTYIKSGKPFFSSSNPPALH